MKLIKIYTILVVSFFALPLEAMSKIIPWENSANTVTKNYSKYVKKTHNMFLKGLGSRRDINNLLKVICTSYVMKGYYDVDKTRELYIHCVDELLRLMNQSSKLKEYSVNYSFSLENLEFQIRFIDQKGNPQRGKWISYIVNKDNKIYYEIRESDETPFILIHKETYEEAKKMLVVNSR